MTNQQSNYPQNNIPQETQHAPMHAAQPVTPPSANAPVTHGQEERLIRKRKRRKKSIKRYKGVKIALIVLLCILGVALLTAIGIFAAFCIGQNAVTSPSEVVDESKVVENNGNTYVYNENIVSILFMGYDQSSKDLNQGQSGQADFLMLVAMDISNGSIKGISIPRDTMVNLGEYLAGAYVGKDKEMQICLAYAYGDGRETSCENTKNAVSELLYNMPIKYYSALNLEGIGPINDAIGGVTLTPIESIPNTPITKGEKITLLGNNARKYVQWRDYNRLDAAELRRQRQVQYINEFYKQAFSQNDNKIGTAISLFSEFSKYCVTNVGLPEVSYLAQNIFSKGISEFSITSVPGQLTQGEMYPEYYPDKEKTYEIVLDTFYTKQ